jgi:uncharacterized protein
VSRPLSDLIIWRGLDSRRLEAVRMAWGDESLVATGTQIGTSPEGYRLDYRLEVGEGWLTRVLELTAAGHGFERTLKLERTDRGWSAQRTGDGPAGDLDAAALEDAVDCDLGFSPLTNLMPVRRHRLHEVAGGADLVAAWVSVPDLDVFASKQRYEHVRRDVVRYIDRGVAAGFTAELVLDRLGVVRHYPELAERVE